MKTEIDWDNAPEGATHYASAYKWKYFTNFAGYWPIGGDFFPYDLEDGKGTNHSADDFNVIESRPEMPSANDLVDDDSRQARISNIGNVLHNISCSTVDEDEQSELGMYAAYLWDLAGHFGKMDCGKTAEPKPELPPVYTQAMCDAGELPSVGSEVRYTLIENDSNTTLEAGQYVYGKIIAYHDGFVWTSDNGLRKLSNTKFKPTLPPIQLIDGEAYQFDYICTVEKINRIGMKGFKRDDPTGRIDLVDMKTHKHYDSSKCSAIKHLT